MYKYLLISFIFVSSALNISDLGAMKRRILSRWESEHPTTGATQPLQAAPLLPLVTPAPQFEDIRAPQVETPAEYESSQDEGSGSDLPAKVQKKQADSFVPELLSQAEELRVSRNFRNAIDLYDKIILFENKLQEKSVAYFVACAGLAEIHRNLENFVNAMEYYNLIVNSYECRSKRVDIYVNANYWLGDIYRINEGGIPRDINKSLRYYKSVISIYDSLISDDAGDCSDVVLKNMLDAYIWAKIWMGQLYFEKLDYQKAQEYFNQVYVTINIKSVHPAAYLWALEGLGACELKIGSDKKAKDYYLEAVKFPRADEICYDALVSIRESIKELIN